MHKLKNKKNEQFNFHFLIKYQDHYITEYNRIRTIYQIIFLIISFQDTKILFLFSSLIHSEMIPNVRATIRI